MKSPEIKKTAPGALSFGGQGEGKNAAWNTGGAGFQGLLWEGLLLQRYALAVHIDPAGEDHDALDKPPDGGYDGSQAAGDDGDDQLDDGLCDIAQIKVMYTQAPKEDAQEPGHQLGLLLALGDRPAEGHAALGADSSVGVGGAAAAIKKTIWKFPIPYDIISPSNIRGA